MSIIKSYALKNLVRKVLYSPVGNKVFTAVGGRIYADRLVRFNKKRMLECAYNQFKTQSQFGTFDDYKAALNKHWVSFSEYAYQYEFWRLSEKERDEYISRLETDYFYWRYVPGINKLIFRDKQKFLNYFGKYIHRKWLYVPDASFDEFNHLLTEYDCIVKPTDGTCGQGIFKVYKEQTGDKKELYDNWTKQKLLVEQCIEACAEIQAFHPQSLNTIRVVTFSNKEKAIVFGSFLRMGVGDAVVDNAHAGGLFAQINVESGIIESDGIDVNGNVSETHPDSGIRIKGFRIPQWEKIVEICCEVAKTIDNPITGWDVVVTDKNQIEFVEGNHGPDFDVMQSPMKVGVKKKVYSLIKEYYGVELK